MVDKNLVQAEGRRALRSLEEARKALSSAKNWGLWDLFGGGFFVTAIKHFRLSQAQNSLNEASAAMRRFREVLTAMPNLSIDIGPFLTLADFFFDGFWSDILVQMRISEARDKVDRAIREVNRILSSL